ncbi:hypothetical protein ACLB2K_034846 [Fragaria x ananassa]
MDSSKPYVRLSEAQDISEASNPRQKLGVSSSSSMSGSLPIRAPLTLDSDSDSDSQINGDTELGYITSSSKISVGSECGFVSGEEFETALERPFVAAELGEESGSVERYEVHWSYVSDPDEDEGVVGRVMVGGQASEGVRPIANLCWESDGSEVVDEEIEEEVGGENSGLLGHVKALVSIAPRVKVSEFVEGEEDESLVVEESNFVEGGNGDSVRVECVEDCSFGTAESSETNSVEMNLNVLEGGEGDKCIEEGSFVHESSEKLEELDVEDNENQSFATAESSETNSVGLNVNVLEGGEKDKYVEEESFVHESFEKLEELDVEGNENQSMGDSHVSEAEEDKVENSDSFNSMTPRSVLGENEATGLKIEDLVANGKGLVSFGDTGVQFQDNEAKVEVSFKEKGSTMEQDLTCLGVFVESVPHGIKIFEIEEEEELVNGKDSSNSCVKLFEPATEVKGVENSDLKTIVKYQTGESIQAEWSEDNGLGGVETKEPNNLEKAKSMADECIMHCSKSKMSDVNIRQNSGALDSGVHSECDFDVEGSGNQVTDSKTYAQPNPILKILYLGKRNLSEAAEADEYILCSDFLESITPSSSVTHEHIFGGETRVRNCKIGRRFAGVTVTHLGDDATTGLKIEDHIAIGKHLVLAGSAGAVQCQGETACGAKLELCLKEKNFPLKQDKTSLGLSLMKWGGGLVLTADILSRFSVGSSNIAVHAVLDNKQRGKISIRTSNSDKIQSAGIIGILSIAVSVFGFFRSKFNNQNSRY